MTPLFITQRGRAAAVLLSMKECEHTQHALEILNVLAQGENEGSSAELLNNPDVKKAYLGG